MVVHKQHVRLKKGKRRQQNQAEKPYGAAHGGPRIISFGRIFGVNGETKVYLNIEAGLSGGKKGRAHACIESLSNFGARVRGECKQFSKAQRSVCLSLSSSRVSLLLFVFLFHFPPGLFFRSLFHPQRSSFALNSSACSARKGCSSSCVSRARRGLFGPKTIIRLLRKHAQASSEPRLICLCKSTINERRPERRRPAAAAAAALLPAPCTLDIAHMYVVLDIRHRSPPLFLSTPTYTLTHTFARFETTLTASLTLPPPSLSLFCSPGLFFLVLLSQRSVFDLRRQFRARVLRR